MRLWFYCHRPLVRLTAHAKLPSQSQTDFPIAWYTRLSWRLLSKWYGFTDMSVIECFHSCFTIVF